MQARGEKGPTIYIVSQNFNGEKMINEKLVHNRTERKGERKNETKLTEKMKRKTFFLPL